MNSQGAYYTLTKLLVIIINIFLALGCYVLLTELNNNIQGLPCNISFDIIHLITYIHLNKNVNDKNEEITPVYDLEATSN